ncbi:hypothetical protein [uncultured Streptomyces sp.]|uniref:hypothetical protein n=1 Tax=uncultured Streptomyces sp. TaxID=174707 RepID=UPI00262D7810|nr:hypothetical protein [uncultured Streptomyces sp.]
METTGAKTPTTPAAEDEQEKKQTSSTGVTTLDKDARTEGSADAAGPHDTEDEAFSDEDASLDDEPDAFEEAARNVGSGAGAVIAAGVAVVSLVGGWTGKVAAERETLIGQIKTSGGGSAAQQVSEIYGDAWHTTALVNGVFAVIALLVGVFVLVRPAFGAPSDRPQPTWIRSVALGGVVLAAFSILISVAMYFDLIVGLPAAG